MGKSFADAFMASYKEYKLPPGLSEHFEAAECLAQNENGETYLLTEKDSGTRYVLKAFPKTSAVPPVGAGLLKELSHKGLPRFEMILESEDTVFTVWEYAEGVTLNQYFEEHPAGRIQILDIVTQLCDILTYLHSLPEPIIHRDIKPSNIIIEPQSGKVTLIDFGICRKYSEDTVSDTVCLGTQWFAPPEQYGFMQTDCRADLYALGVLLRYMHTGKTEMNVSTRDRKLDKVIQKCTAFSPAERYKSASALKKALRVANRRTGRKIALGFAAALTAFALFAGGFMAGASFGRPEASPDPPDQPNAGNAEMNPGDTGTDPGGAPTPAVTEPVVFAEPQVERAVRMALSKGDEDVIARDELKNVTHLYFKADGVADTRQKYYDLSRIYEENNSREVGKLYTLEDFRMLTGLREVIFSIQPFTDITPLSDCRELRYIDFEDCHLGDLAPLAGCERLENIRLAVCDGITDISPLAGVPSLKKIHLQFINPEDLSCINEMRTLKIIDLLLPGSRLDSLAEWKDLTLLEELHLSLWIPNLDGIENFSRLRVLNLDGEAAVADLSAIDGLPSLRRFRFPPDRKGWASFVRDDLDYWW